MHFASDNTGPVHPTIMQALSEANAGYAPSYGTDPLMSEVETRIREIFEAPEASVYLVATGTAANCLGLACLAPPTHTVFCTPNAHIHEDECNAPEFYTGGAKLTLVGKTDKMTSHTLRAAIDAEEIRGVHGPQRGPVSLTQATEKGQIYSLAELCALTEVARDYALPVQMDGARFANALVTLNCSAADMTWRAGVDVLSFGGTKNGCMGVEAVVLFDPARAWEFELRRKRGAHLFSKHRYLSAQMASYLRDDLWLQTARRANDNMARLTEGLLTLEGVALRYPVEANLSFIEMPRAALQRLQAAGAAFSVYEGVLDGPDPNERLLIRLVADWAVQSEDIARFVEIAGG